MKVILSNFKLWRLKKTFCLLMCISSSLFLAVSLKYTEKIGVFIVISLVVYGYMIEQPFMKKNYIASIEKNEQDISIIMNNKILKIEKDKIRKVYMKQISYGGRWLETVGNRLVVITDDKTYHFDSAFKNKNNNDSEDIYKLYEMIMENSNIKRKK